MFIIRNRYLPLKGFDAITILNFVFVRKRECLTHSLLRHEQIHWAQEKELLILGFYLLYLAEFIIRLLYQLLVKHNLRGRPAHAAYRALSFEREAYSNQDNKDYLKNRKYYSWTKYL